MFISGDLDEFQGENRGGRHIDEFYDYFPDLEKAAREYTIERCLQKSVDFTVMDLAKFIDEQYYKTTNKEKGGFFMNNIFFSYIF